jgi:hypothetical protein
MKRALLPALVIASVVAVSLPSHTPASALPVAPPGTVVPIQVTGPTSARFNLVIVGDGYQAAELPKFREQVNKHLRVLFSVEPFKSYREYMNVYAVEVASPVSGIDCDPDLDSPRRKTPLRMAMWSGCDPQGVQRALVVDAAAANRYADLVPGTTSANRQLLAMANSVTYGGTGGAAATATGGNAMSALITPHELGHSLGGLQDEYDYEQRGRRGPKYTGGEPSSAQHTLLTEQQLKDNQVKWHRWLGEPSLSGETVGRYESGLYTGGGVWRPSTHSMMKVLGYYFDQVSLEVMTQKLAAKTSLIQDSTPTIATLGTDRIVWVDTMHPRDHELDVRWTVDDKELPGTDNRRVLDVNMLRLAEGKHTVTATVVDPTEFVRDPAVRSSTALTATRTWNLDSSVTTPPRQVAADFSRSTPTDRPTAADQVVYVDTTHRDDQDFTVVWELDGELLDNPGNDRDLDLRPFGLTGDHTLTATVADPVTGAVTGRREWRVDGSPARVVKEMSPPLLKVADADGDKYFYNAPFTMGLSGTDNTPGHVVREFRMNGDGWYHYFGWPTDETKPFLFTADGTVVDSLVYGKLGSAKIVPWDPAPSGYGTHTIEYRGIDPAGNIGKPEKMRVTLRKPSPTCTTTITGPHRGLTVESGVTCLTGATVDGDVRVGSEASLVLLDSTVGGSIRADRSAVVELHRSTVTGTVALAVTGSVSVIGSTVGGDVAIERAGADSVVAGSRVAGQLWCSPETPAMSDLNAANTVGAHLACAGL